MSGWVNPQRDASRRRRAARGRRIAGRTAARSCCATANSRCGPAARSLAQRRRVRARHLDCGRRHLRRQARAPVREWPRSRRARNRASAPRRRRSTSRPWCSTSDGAPHFGGQLAEFKLHKRSADARSRCRRSRRRARISTSSVFHEVGGHWPWQVKQWRGLQEPQDPWTLPSGQGAVQQARREAAGARARSSLPPAPRRLDARPLAPGRGAQGRREAGRDLRR